MKCSRCPTEGRTYAVRLEDSVLRVYALCSAHRTGLGLILKQACKRFDEETNVSWNYLGILVNTATARGLLVEVSLLAFSCEEEKRPEVWRVALTEEVSGLCYTGQGGTACDAMKAALEAQARHTHSGL